MTPSSQTNTQAGKITRKANVDLTAKEGFLAKLINNAGSNEAALPTALTDHVGFVVVDGDALGNDVSLQPLEPGVQVRIKAKGAGVCGDLLSLADPTTPADAGKVRKVPAVTGTYPALLIAEETFVDGQNVLCRSISREAIVVA